MANERKYNTLNPKQLHILTLLYKFRFATIPLLTHYKGLKTETTLLRNLNLLQEQAYVDRHFDLSFKIDRKPAYYFLTKKGIAVFKDDSRFDPNVLHSYYKNKSLSEAFMQHCADVLMAYNTLHQTYGDSFKIFTKPELAAFEDFPETKPDLFLRGENEYFMTLVHDQQLFITKKRLAEYIEHSEEEGWEGGQYPGLLFVLSDSNAESRFLEHAKKTLESAGIDEDELRIGATTIKAVRSKLYTSTIWTFVGANVVPSELTHI